MPVEMRLWRIADGNLEPVASEELPLEERLEDWLARDLSMVSDDLLIVGRQVASDLGGVLDILAIDRNGDLAVLELKRHRTPREVVAQALHYAAWVRTLSWEEIEEIGTQHHEGTFFATEFENRFGRPPPDTINTAHRIYIVAAEMDAVSEAIVRYLSEEYSVTVNVVFFRYFIDSDGREYLGRSWLMEPSEVEQRGDDAPGKRRRSLSLEELERRADERGVGPQYQALFRFFSRHAKQTRRTRSNVAFAFRVDDQTRAVFSIYPDNSSAEAGLWVDVRADYLARAFSVSEKAVRDALPDEVEPDAWAYGEIYHFRTTADVDRLLAALSHDAAGDTSDCE